MGQQQLLLLVLGIVIVGLAVVVGIQAFGENQKKANSDAMTNDVIRIASDAQAWSLKPKAFGGGDGNFGATSATGVTLEKLGYTTTSNVYTNLNADVASGGTGSGYTLTWNSASKITIRGTNTKQANGVVAVVCGTSPKSIATSVGVAAVAAPDCPA